MSTDYGCSNTHPLAIQIATELHRHPAGSEHPEQGRDPSLSHPLPVHTPDPLETDLRKRLRLSHDPVAQANRSHFQARGLLVLNILASPGSGKTTLIERMTKIRGNRASQVGVMIGDLATENDVQRLRAAGATTWQIPSNTACRLEAEAIAQAVSGRDTTHLDLLMIENVSHPTGSTVYDLGETLRIVLLSVTEGEDKPLQFPAAFESADVVLITKLDLAEAVGFDQMTAIANIRRIAPQAPVFEVSARTGLGMHLWLMYLQSRQHLQRLAPEQLRNTHPAFNSLGAFTS